jgi:hypothetical protein
MDLATFNDWKKLDVEVLKLIYDQGEKRLQQTVITAETLTGRAATLIQIYVVIVAGCIAYISENIGYKTVPQGLCILGIVVGFIVLFKTVLVFKMYKIRPTGNKGCNLITQELANQESEQDQLRWFLYSGIRGLDDLVDENRTKNDDRATDLATIIQITKWWLVASAAYALLGLI